MAAAVTMDNKYLFTGDTQGIGRTWDLSQATAALAAVTPALLESEYGSRGTSARVSAVARWRAHGRGVSSAAAVDNRHDVVLTSGQDCAVSLWTANGARIGTFGEVGHVAVSDAVLWLLRAVSRAGCPIVAAGILTTGPWVARSLVPGYGC